MRIASLLIPAYMPPAYAGATPTPYQSSTVDNFERDLVKLSPLVVRHGNATTLRPDLHGRFVHQGIHTRYDVALQDDKKTDGYVLGDAVLLALKAFKLESITVICNGEADEINVGAVEELQAGLHDLMPEEF